MAIKSWFDFLFAAAGVPYGLGFIAVLWADLCRSEPLLPRAVSYVGIAIGAAAAISGLGYVLGVLHLPLVIGLTVTFGCVILAALGARSCGASRSRPEERKPDLDRTSRAVEARQSGDVAIGICVLIKVHHLNNSRSQRVLWLLEEIGLDYEVIRYQRDAKTMLGPPSLRRIHP